MLFSANFYGTLAAARCLGRNGMDVTVADPAVGARELVALRRRRVQCPPESQPEAFLQWLVDFGLREPVKHVLYPTSDELAWLISAHRAKLEDSSTSTTRAWTRSYGLLNKRRLYELGTEAGLHLPRTWFPESEADLEQVRREARFPVLIKPTTQILYATHRKGQPVSAPDELARGYREFCARHVRGPCW